MDTIILVIMILESNGNLMAVNGEHYGVLQISEACWSDVRTGKFNKEKLFDPEYSRSIFIDYINRWAPNKTPVEIARIWHGGPQGHKKSSTRDYGRRFMILYNILEWSTKDWYKLNAASFLFLGRRACNLQEISDSVDYFKEYCFEEN